MKSGEKIQSHLRVKLSRQTEIEVPIYFEPRPYQERAWNIIEHGDEEHGRPNFVILLWSRRAGKDTFSQQRILNTGFWEPGQQHVYVGIDNVWIRDNIFQMYIEGRTFWDEYPEGVIDVKDTKREVFFTNNPPDKAPTRIKYVGLKNENGVVGSGYRDWMISDTGLFPDGSFDYLFPIWQDKKQQGIKFQVVINGTPRGMNQELYKLCEKFTGETDPKLFPGWHETAFGTCYVDHITIEDIQVPIRDEETGERLGGYKYLYSQEDIEELRMDAIRAFGNDKWFRQEFYCDFHAVNAGLVYQGWEYVKEEERYTVVNRNPNHPVYLTFDLGSKGKFTDATSAIYWQYFSGTLRILDTYETRGKALVEALADMSANDLFKHVTFASLPWDVERGYTEKSALDEARERYKNINFEPLKQTPAVRQDIEHAQLLMPNLWVDNRGSTDTTEGATGSGGAWFCKCIEQYQYRRIDKMDDWGKPLHDWSSHMMDTFRYVAMTIKAAEAGQFYLGTMKKPKTSYGSIFDTPKDSGKSPIYMTQKEREVWNEQQARRATSGLGGLDDSRRNKWSF